MTSCKRASSIFLLGTATLALAACDGADDVASPGEGNLITIVTPAPPPPPPAAPTPPPPTTGGAFTGATPAGMVDRGVIGGRRVFELPSRFTQDTTLQNLPGAVYQIAGPVNVGTDIGGDGRAAGGQSATLTIQPGAIFVATDGTSYLAVNRGSRINAVGTATNPIIFTADDQINGTVTDSSQGLWGGIILLGRAPISDCQAGAVGGTEQCQQVVEGTTNSLYGGALPNDNSGSLRFVQIRYSGVSLAPGNELQGLTMGGVGNNTTIDHVQVHNSSDDGIEIFGGRVNTKYLALTGADDDSLDTDVGYRGTNQFVIGIQRPTGDGDSHIEADSNNNEEALPRQYTRVSNATFVQTRTSTGGNTLLLRGGTDYALLNSVVVGTAQACLDIDETGGTTTRTAANPALQELGAPVFRSVVFACPTLYRNDGNVTVETIASIFGTGANGNNSAFTSTLTNVFVNGANETAVIPTDPTAFNADQFGGTANTGGPNRLETVAFIGAVRNAQDANFAGWTCNAGYVNFNVGTTMSTSCTALPAIPVT